MALAIGCTYAAAAENADIGYSTLRSWILYGERAREEAAAGTVLSREAAKYLAFLEAVEGAKAEALLRWQQTVNRAAEVDPAWAWKMLQVRAPEDYTPPQRVEVTGKDGDAVQHEHRGQTHGSVEHVAAVLATLAAVGGIQLPGDGGGDAAEDDAVHPTPADA